MKRGKLFASFSRVGDDFNFAFVAKFLQTFRKVTTGNLRIQSAPQVFEKLVAIGVPMGAQRYTNLQNDLESLDFVSIFPERSFVHDKAMNVVEFLLEKLPVEGVHQGIHHFLIRNYIVPIFL